MTLETWLSNRDDALSREFLRLLKSDEGTAIEGDDPNLLGLDIETPCGCDICDDVERTRHYDSQHITMAAKRLHKRAQVVLYG